MPATEKLMELIELELEKARKLATQADNALLVYLIDMALQEAENRHGNSGSDCKTPPRNLSEE